MWLPNQANAEQRCVAGECGNWVERYDVQADSWSVQGVPRLAWGRAHLAGCVFDGRITVMGGRSLSDGQPLASVEHWKPGELSWHRMPPMSTSRSSLAATVAASQLYAIGGFDGNSATASVEIFDLNERKWTRGPPLTVKRQGLAAVTVNERIFAIGGSSGTQALQTVECLDIGAAATGWSTVVTLGSPAHALCAVAHHGQVLTLGGEGRGVVSSAALQHAFNDGSWKPLGNGHMLSARRAGGAAVADSTDIYVCGGHDGNTPLATMERWTPTQRGWLPRCQLSRARSGLILIACPAELCVETASIA